MRFILLGFVAAGAALCGAAVQAQTSEDLVRCRAITDEARRLACYDAIAISPASPRSKYEAISLEEMETYALSYRGRFVEVSGWLDPGERFFLLKRNEQDARSLPVDFRSLTRAEQQAVRDLCGTGCAATIEGQVGPVNFTTGITADAITVR